jgi:hypothetical protein
MISLPDATFSPGIITPTLMSRCQRHCRFAIDYAIILRHFAADFSHFAAASAASLLRLFAIVFTLSRRCRFSPLILRR